MNNIKRSASYHKVELENIITLIRRGKYNNALKYLQEYKNNFGDSHPMYKKIEVILESFYNNNLFELIDNFNNLLESTFSKKLPKEEKYLYSQKVIDFLEYKKKKKKKEINLYYYDNKEDMGKVLKFKK